MIRTWTLLGTSSGFLSSVVTLLCSSVLLEAVSVLACVEVDSVAAVDFAGSEDSSLAASSFFVAFSSGNASSPRSWMIFIAALR